MWTIKKKILYVMYSLTAKKMPVSRRLKCSKYIRNFFFKLITNNKSNNINIEKGAEFGPNVKLGSGSGIGVNCELIGDIKIGENVMMGPEVVMITRNHKFNNLNKPINKQGYEKERTIQICDNVWIGRRVIILPGVKIESGCIIGAGSIVTKSFPKQAIIAGNPAKIIKFRT